MLGRRCLDDGNLTRQDRRSHGDWWGAKCHYTAGFGQHGVVEVVFTHIVSSSGSLLRMSGVFEKVLYEGSSVHEIFLASQAEKYFEAERGTIDWVVSCGVESYRDW